MPLKELVAGLNPEAASRRAPPLRCYLMGERSLLIHCAEVLLERGHAVLGVVAQDRRITELASQRGLPVLDPKRELHPMLSQHPFDYFFSIANFRIVPDEVLALPHKGAINFHDGPLPRYAGLNVPVWALANREATHGIAWHLMRSGVDEGDVLAERTFAVSPRETSFSINTRCYEAAIETFVELVHKLEEGDHSGRKQDLALRSYFGRHHRPPAAGFLDWARPAAELDALVRALDFGPTDNPVAVAKIALSASFDPKDASARSRVLIPTSTEVHASALEPDAPPGRVVALDPTLRIATAAGDLEIAAGRTIEGREIAPAELARQLGLRVGDTLDPIEPGARARLAEVDAATHKADAFWRARLKTRAPMELPSLERAGGDRSIGHATLTLASLAAPGDTTVERAVALVCAFLARVSERPTFDLGYVDPELRRAVLGAEAIHAEYLPLTVSTDSSTTFASLASAVGKELAALRTRGPHGLDLAWRRRDTDGPLPGHRTVVEVGHEPPRALPEGADVAFLVSLDGGAVQLVFDRRSLDEAAAALLIARLCVLCEGALENPSQLVTSLPLLSEAERQKILVEWNATEHPVSGVHTVHGVFEAQVDRTPEAIAIEFEGRRLSYRQLDERANRVAQWLLAQGVVVEDRVAIEVERSEDMVAALLGVMKSGAAYVPVDQRLPESRRRFMKEDAGAKVVLDDATLVEALHGQAGSERPEVTVRKDHLAYVLYTSGSTGRPKGVMVEHTNVVNLLTALVHELGTKPEEITLSLTSLSFDVSVAELLLPLVVGARVVIGSSDAARDPGLIEGILAASGARTFGATPATWRMMVQAGWRPAADMEIHTAGEALSRELADALLERGAKLWNLYGPTEATVYASGVEVGPGRVTIGRPLRNTQLYIVDEHLQPVPIGVAGELCIAGAGVARGYLGRPELTAERFVEDPFASRAGARMYRTGDLARWLARGEVECLGRLDHQVKIRGYRIELGEVESALASLRGVQDVVVVAREDPPDEKRLVAYLVATAGTELAVDALRAELGRTLPEYMVPSAFVVLDALPLTTSGKVDRQALPAPDFAASAGQYVAPRDGVEEILAELFREVLRVERVGVHDDFFALGGHSLLAMQALSRIRRATGTELPVSAVFVSPTVARLAQHVRTKSDSTRGGVPIAREIVRVDRSAPLPASYAQTRLWFLDQLEGGGGATYNVPIVVRLEGAVDVGVLDRAVQGLVERHETLRTTFVAIDGEPHQVVHSSSDVHLSLVEVESEDAARTAVAREVHAPFDLAKGPLLRASLVREGADVHVLVLCIHHIATDGWSSGILLRELSALYGAFAGERPSPLAADALDYADFAVWQRRWLSGEVLAQQLSYWKDHLAGAPSALELPTDRPRPAVKEHQGDTVAFAVPAAVAEGVRALCRREGATPFMVLLAAYQVVLSRWSGQRDVVVGTAIANRTRQETEGVVGFFVNTLAMRTRVESAASFADVVRSVKQSALSAYAHQDVPFEKLVEELGVVRDMSRTPIFQAFLVMQNAESAPLELANLLVTEEHADLAVAKFDLSLGFIEGAKGLHGTLEYDTALFDRATMARFAEHLGVFLEAATRRPEERVATLPLMSDAERRALSRSRVVDPACAGEALIHEVVAERARVTPDAVAIVLGEETVTYGALLDRARRVARALTGLGVGPDVIVAVIAERTPELVVALLGVLLAGGAYLPIDPSTPAQRAAFMVQDSGAALLLVDHASRAPVGTTGVRIDELIGEPGAPLPPRRALPDHLAYVIYTSGTTGRPKGVMVTHRNVMRLFETLDAQLAPTHRDVWSIFHSFAFDFSVFELWGALLRGGSAVIVPREVSRSPADTLDLLERSGVTVLSQTPTAFSQLLSAGAAARPLQALRLIVFGGEALQFASLRSWFDAHGDDRPQLVNMFGITETTVHVTYRRVLAPDARGETWSGIGEAMTDLELLLLDDAMEMVPTGVVGDVYVAGPGLARGYLGRPDLTALRFRPHPFSSFAGDRFYDAGDVARRQRDGEVLYLGRADHQVQLRGYRIELGEIESVLLGSPSVQQAVVVLRSGDSVGDRIVAYVAGFADAPRPQIAELRRALGEQLPEYMVPSVVVVLEALPLTENGKVDRRALPAPDFAESAGDYVAPRDGVEEILAEVFREVLRIERIGVHDDFFALGGHSLLAMQAVSRIRTATGSELPVRALFESPTAARLAQQLRSLSGPTLAQSSISRLDRSAPLPASFAQTRLWFLDQLETGGATYNVPIVLRLLGAVDARALEGALQGLVARHETLRTTFVAIEGQPHQVVNPSLDVRLAVVEAESEDVARAAVVREVHAPFDLANGPVLRASLVRLCEEQHVLVVCIHHIATDAWSSGILLRELSALYGAFAEGRPPPLVAEPLDYADFASWQRTWLSDEVLAQQTAFWRDHLLGAPSGLELPTDRPRPATKQHLGDTVAFAMPAAVADGVRALCRREGATPFMVLLAAYQVVLSRWSGQQDVVVGTAIANRTRQELETVVGFFVNTLAMRTKVGAESSFVDVVRTVKQSALSAYAHQDVPFEKLVEELGVVRDMSRTPIFQAFFVMQNAESAPLQLAGLEVKGESAGLAVAKFDLTLGIEEARDGLEGLLEYDTALFDRSTMARFAEHFGVFLEAATRRPEERVATLPLMSDAERERVVVAWNATTRPFEELAVHAAFERRAAERPDALAVTWGERQLTYGGLNRRANRLAAILRRRGVGPEHRVATLIRRSEDLIVAQLAVLKAGAAYVPLDPSHPPARLAFFVADVGATLVLSIVEASEGVQVGVEVVCLDDPRVVEELERAGEEDLSQEVAPHQAAYVIYTSGSTGQPKGALIEHRSLSNLASQHRRVMGLEASDRVGQVQSLAFDGTMNDIWPTLACGASLHIADEDVRRSPMELVRWMRHRAVTVTCTTAPLAELMLDEDWTGTSLRAISYGGQALRRRPRGHEPFRCVNIYGPTEATVYVTCEDVEPGEHRVTTIGRPVQNSAVYLLDVEDQPTPSGVFGELHIGGTNVGRGYVGRPALTAERYIPDAWGAQPGARVYRTGDRARWLADGRLEFGGRHDDQVKVRGYRIELGEIESALAVIGGVRESVVLARSDGPGERRLVAYLVAAEGIELAVDVLRAELGRSLPEYMVPSAFVVLDALPMSPNGKVDRNALPAPGIAEATSAYVAPRDPVEQVVVDIWSDVLGAEHLGIHDDFFERGGHSLLAARLIARVRQAFGVALPLRSLFEARTPARIAALIRASAREEDEALTAAVGVSSGEVPATYAQERLWFLSRLAPGSSAYNLWATRHLRGPLDEEALRGALVDLAAGHVVLRTTLEDRGAGVVQVVHSSGGIPLELHDVTAVSGDRRLEVGRRSADEFARRPFDLAAGPLARALLVRLGPADQILCLSFHHAIVDGWSLSLLSRDLRTAYGARLRGAAPATRAAGPDYSDFATWQRAKPSRFDHQLGYWKSALEGAPAALELPTDRPRPARLDGRGSLVTAVIEPSVAERLRAVAREEGATTFMALLAVLDTVLSRWANQDDVVVGTPMANRALPGTEEMVGLFLESLALRTKVAPGSSFRDVLRAVKTSCLEAFAHADVPFDRIVEALAPERNVARHPIFQVFFNLVNVPEAAFELEGLKSEELSVLDLDSKFDLTLYAQERGGGVELSCVFATQLFDAVRMEELLAQLQRAADAFGRRPDEPHERASTRGARPVLPDPTCALETRGSPRLLDVLSRHVAERPAAPAAQDASECYSFAELDATSATIAHQLAGMSVGEGQVVAVLAQRSASLLAAVIGVLRSGAAFTIVDPAHPPERTRRQVQLALPRALVVVGDAPVETTLEEAGLAVLPRLAVRRIVPGTSTTPLPSRRGGTLAYVAFTSGTSGEPKAIAGTLEPVEHFLDWQASTFGLGAADRGSMLSGLAHDPLLRDLFAPLWSGGCVVAPPFQLAESTGRWLRDAKITLAHLTPQIGELVVTGTAGELPDLRAVFFGGDALPMALARRLLESAPRARCVSLYGATETPQGMGYHEITRRDLDGEGPSTAPLGRGIDGVELLVVAAGERPAAVGEVGEIWIRSRHLARYVTGEDAGQAKFSANPFRSDPEDGVYRTGDLGRYRADGAVVFAGRRDRQLKVRGFRVEPGEIEATLRREAGVEAAHAGVVELHGRPTLVAWVVGPRAGETGELRRALERALPAASVPAHLLVVPGIPLGATGKVDRAALPLPTIEPSIEEPRSPSEQTVASVLGEALGISSLSPTSDFFASGGHSLLVPRIAARLSALFGLEVPLSWFFEAPTARGLATRLEDTRSGEPMSPLRPRAAGSATPLSFAQERLWFLHQLDPESSAYNLLIAVRIDGAFDVAAWADALGDVGCRHASLRTRFSEGSEGRLQHVDEEPSWRLEVVDLSGEPGTAEDHLADARERLRRAGLAPFDLATGPLVRASVWKVGPDAYVALLALHHAIADGWSLGVLVRDLTDAYAARRTGAAPAWSPLPIDYADFSVWQREALHGPRLDRQLAYHKGALQGAPTLLELPTDRPRSPIRRQGARRLAVQIEQGVADRVRDLARSAGATPFMVLLAAFGAMLGRASRQKDLVVGSPIAGRTVPETEPLVGFFVNTLALRIQLHEEPTFLGLLERVRATCLGAYANQDLPFERLVEELAPERRLDATPIFQVLFLLQSQPRSALALPGAQVELLERQVEAAKFDLVLALHEEAGGFAGRFDYSADLFEASSAEGLWRAFHELLAAAVRAPETPISRLAMVDVEARSRLLEEYNRTALDYPPLAIHQMIEAQIDATPDATALVFEDHAVTYLELERRANQIAHRLRGLGVQQGDRVALCVERSLELIIAQLGIMKAGAAYVGLDPNYPAARLALMIETAAASAVVTQARFRSGATGVGTLAVPRVLVDADASELCEQPTSRLGLRVHPDDPAYVLFTSGSTGRPKGVCIHHRGVPSLMKDIHRLAPTGPGDRSTFWTSISFDVSVKEIFSTLFTGGALWIATEELRADPDLFAQWLLDHGIHGAYVAPFGIDAFLRALERVGSTPMKRLFVGVEPIPERTLARIGDLGPELVVLNSYGPTEATICCTLYVCPSTERGDRPSVIGFPTANTQLYVLDDQLDFTPRGARGELYIGGIQVGPGYWGSPRETAERFVPDHLGKVAGGRLYRTGDLVRMRSDLAIEFWGRIDNQVKVRGHRIELGEIEAATLACAGVRNAVAVVQGQGEDKRLVVYFVPDPAAPPSTPVLREHLKSRLPEAWMPSRFLAMGSLPLTPSGKIDRKALPEVDAEVELHVAPRTPIEELVATAFAELLGKEEVSAEADFFASGGHSLLATRLVSRLRQTLGIALPLRAVFESPTVAALAAHVVSLGAGGGSSFEVEPIEHADRGAPIRASFTQERLWMLDRLEPGSPAYQIRSVLRITGPVDEAALRRAFVAVVQRHEALRTRLEERDGVIVQTWASGSAATLEIVDLSPYPEPERTESATRLAVAEADRAFDLGRDLPVRARLLRLGDELRWLVLTVHHAMSDGWSMSIVRRDLGLAYEGILGGSVPQLPPLPLQFADFAAWQRRRLESDAGRALVTSWARRLEAAPPALTLRTDHPRPASWDPRGASIDQAIPIELARRITSFCRREAVTPFMVLLAAYAAVLGRRAGQDDVVLGSPIAGRTRADVENVVGPFINVLPLRVQLHGAPSFSALCARAREIVLEAHAHQEVPFEHLLEVLDVRRDTARSPLFQAYLNMLNQPSEDLALPGTTSERLFAGTTVARFDLTLYARLDATGGQLGLVYATALFEESTARSFLDQLLVLLDAALAAPDSLVDQLPLIVPERRAELRAKATAVVVAQPFEAMPREVLEASLDDRFRDIAARHADQIAVVAGEERLTYRELRERSERAAAALGDVRRVALLFDHDASMVTGILAALTAGAAYVPLDATHPVERLAFMLRDSGAEAILTDAPRMGLAMELAGGLRVVDVAAPEAASERVRRPSSAEDLAYVLYTSGSTGRPKGVMQSHRNVLGHIRAYVNALHLGPEDRLTLFSTYGFDAAVMDLFGALLTGATLLLERLAASTPEELWRWVRAEQVTVLHATPTAFRHIASAGQTEVASSVRLVVLGGEPVHPADVAICRTLFAPGTIFVNGLGPTESTLALQQFIDPWAFEPSDGVPVGYPVDETEVLLLGPDGTPVGDYGVGEICIVSSRVALGYVNQPEVTSRAFSPAPGGDPGRRMYRTGDLGRLLPSGAVAHVGRADDQVKIRGHRIELGEVEAVLRGLPGVLKAAAALHEVEGAPRLCAYLVGPPAPLDAGELRRELRLRLPEAMVPADFVAIEAIPLTPTGKVDRRALPLPASQPSVVRGRLTAKDALEARLGQVWSEVLKRPVPFDADFFDLGGNSLVAVRLVASIERTFGHLLPLRTVFSHPTVEEMIELLR